MEMIFNDMEMAWQPDSTAWLLRSMGAGAGEGAGGQAVVYLSSQPYRWGAPSKGGRRPGEAWLGGGRGETP